MILKSHDKNSDAQEETHCLFDDIVRKIIKIFSVSKCRLDYKGWRNTRKEKVQRKKAKLESSWVITEDISFPDNITRASTQSHIFKDTLV